jgi:amino acid adenylation domain-containing protein
MYSERKSFICASERLAPASARVWVLSHLLPESAQWSVPLLLRLPAGIADESVHYALRAVVGRHEVLRACFHVDGTQVWRTITGDGAAEFRTVELGVPELADTIGQELRRGFDLEHGPLLRALLCRLPDRAPILFAVTHRMAADVLPPALIGRELAEFCATRHESRPPALSAPDTRPASAVERPWTARDLEYWCKQLAGLAPVNLPLDRPRPPRWDGRGSAVTFSLPAPTSDEIGRIARQAGTTVSRVLLTALASVIARHTGQWAMAIGSPAGHAVQPAVWPVRLDGSMTFRDAVRALHRTHESLAARPFPPFERLIEVLAPERDLSRAPIYQVAFEMADASTGDDAGPGTGADECITALAHDAIWGVAHTDIALSVRQSPGGPMAGVLSYAVGLFDESTVRAFADHFQRFLSAVVRDPRVVLADVGMLSDAEYHQVSAGWTGAADVRDLRLPTVIEQFEACAARTPAASAVVVSNGGAICYRDLESRANHLAARLTALGAGSGENVGVLLNRGIDMVACMLAVGKAGAAYLPMDPDLPVGRLGYMLEDSGVRVVLTDSACAGKITSFATVSVIVDADPELAQGPATRPGAAPNPDDAAYVIYTSGSTGRPKAVQVTHRSLANYVRWAATTLVRDGTCGTALFSSVAFDLVVTTLWTPLVTSRTLFVVAQRGLPGDFQAMVPAGERLSFLKMTPGHLEILRAQLGAERMATLADYLVVGGEPLPGPTASKWLDVLGPGRLINSYGPTEATVATCVYPVTSHVGQEVTPIGRRLPNVSVFVLDPAMRPVPVGVVGELYIGGTGVARGYHRRPWLTAERFVPDPFGLPGGRLYRTGDLARWLTTGDLAFAGRADDQVKIMGYRVEPGEVASVVADCPGVAAAAVLAVGSGESHHRLVAFYVPDNGSGPAAGTGNAVEAHCAASLPAYMVPAEYLAVPELPRTANGKIDRSALIEAMGRAQARAPRRPGTALEKEIAAVWAALLGTEPDLDTDFFAAGGNSVLAVRFGSVLSDALGIPVPPWALFSAPTVERLAAALGEATRADRPPERESPSEVEQLIGVLFEDVLAIWNVGPDDSFFAVGGDSILAFKLLDAAQQQGVVFELADLYELQTPRSLAKVAVRRAPAVPAEATEREFWRGYLAGFDGESRLFTDSGEISGSIRGLGSVTVECGTEPGRQLEAARGAGDSGLPVLFHAAAAVLAAKLGQYGDVVLGTSAAERGRGRDEPVPLRCAVDPAVTVAGFLDAVRDGMRLVSRHRLLSLKEISDVTELRQPLQVLVTTGDLLADGSDDFDLILFLELGGLSPRVTVRYETALFTRATAGRLADAACRLMDFLDTRPHDRLGQAPLVDDRDRRALQALWSDVSGPAIRFGEAAISALITAPAWPEFVDQAGQRGLLSALLLAL